jgi:hypothetical protein
VIHAGRLTVAQAKRQRKQLLDEIAQEHRRKEREKLSTLRGDIRAVKRRRAEAMREAVQRCREERHAVKERAKERRRELRDQLREALQGEKLAAREACSARKAEVRQGGASAIQKARELVRAERAYQAELRRLEQRAKKRERRTTARERRAESDDEVRSNVPADLLPLFERVKRTIRGSDRQSRSEAFLRYAEEHPSEVIAAMSDLSEREIAKLVAEEKRLAKAVRSPRRYRPTPEELANIPF